MIRSTHSSRRQDTVVALYAKLVLEKGLLGACRGNLIAIAGWEGKGQAPKNVAPRYYMIAGATMCEAIY
eukprot:8191956-Pyramimonas_sp.AAC.1